MYKIHCLQHVFKVVFFSIRYKFIYKILEFMETRKCSVNFAFQHKTQNARTANKSGNKLYKFINIRKSNEICFNRIILSLKLLFFENVYPWLDYPSKHEMACSLAVVRIMWRIWGPLHQIPPQKDNGSLLKWLAFKVNVLLSGKIVLRFVFQSMCCLHKRFKPGYAEAIWNTLVEKCMG